MAMKTKTTANVGALTFQGMELFHQAMEKFEDAYRQATQLNNASCECNSAFNLSEVYIANQQPDKALEMLNTAWQRCGGIEDITLKADLYYNYGLVYELLGKDKLAVDNLKRALEQYQTQPDKTLITANLAAKIGDVYTKLKNMPQAARNHQVAAELYEQIGEFDKYVMQLCKQANQLFEGGTEQGAKEVADTCMDNCQSMKKTETLGHIYNELGLIYSQCSEFKKAVKCFEMALRLCRVPPGGSSNMQAVILQNLGATYNIFRKYQQALQFHEQAAEVHATQYNRKSQGKCFLNLAYAYTQLGDYDKAREFYLHALQAAKDADSKHDQWQSMEGAGVVAFHENRLECAEKYFTMALNILKAAPESNSVASNRIAVKLTDVRKYQETISVVQAPAQILVNDEPRPPTREEQRQMEELRYLPSPPPVPKHVTPPSPDMLMATYEKPISSDQHADATQYNRKSQGKCFLNLAYAYTQLGDYDKAGEFYLHALQAAKDADSKHDQWQSMEGAGVVAFHQNRLECAEKYFTMALNILKAASESNSVASYRIAVKLTDVRKYQETISVVQAPAQILVNDEPRPPTREEQRQMEELRTRYDGHRSDTVVSYQPKYGSTRERAESERKYVRNRSTNQRSDSDPKRSGAKERSQSSDSSESGSSMDTLARYVEQLEMADEDVTDSQDYESGEDVGRENSTNPKKEPIAQPGPLGDSSRYLPSPPPVPKHVTPPSPDMLMATYKKPISSDQHADGKDDDDPSYVTIRSVNRNKASFSEDNEMPSTSYEMAPPVPQRNSGPSSPSRSAGLPYDPNYPEIRELHLDSYGIKREDQFDPLPYWKKKKTTSNMCAVM